MTPPGSAHRGCTSNQKKQLMHASPPPQKKMLNCFHSREKKMCYRCGKRACMGTMLTTGSCNAMIYEIWHAWNAIDIVIAVCCEPPLISNFNVLCVSHAIALMNGRILGTSLQLRHKTPSVATNRPKKKCKTIFNTFTPFDSFSPPKQSERMVLQRFAGIECSRNKIQNNTNAHAHMAKNVWQIGMLECVPAYLTQTKPAAPSTENYSPAKPTLSRATQNHEGGEYTYTYIYHIKVTRGLGS